jgi:hypothetical protein
MVCSVRIKISVEASSTKQCIGVGMHFQVNGLLLLLEPLLASAAAFVTRPAWGFSQGVVETEGSTEGSSAQADNIFHSLHLNLREAVPSMADFIPRLLNSVKHLHVCLMKLVRTASSDAGVLHKASLYIFLVLPTCGFDAGIFLQRCESPENMNS